jgi:2'-5' RNA ligase
VKWVEKENLHVTLKFLGNLAPEDLNKVTLVLKETVPHWKPFPVTIGRWGAFPTMKRPRVIWLGIQSEEDRLSRMAQSLEKSLSQIGFNPEEKGIHLHLTLGRFRKVVDLTGKLEEEVSDLSCQFECRWVTLFQSKLSSRGPTYIPLEKIWLKSS